MYALAYSLACIHKYTHTHTESHKHESMELFLAVALLPVWVCVLQPQDTVEQVHLLGSIVCSVFRPVVVSLCRITT